MKYDKEVIAKIAGIENWGEFEEFVKSLYARNKGTIDVVRNYTAKGTSGRKREVDVFVTFGFNPHRLSLGIECKYWAQKVDGDIIDIAAAKKEDLKIDKFAVITTVGFEAGAEFYAKEKNIDLFIVRPSIDDDFGYSGRIVKFKLYLNGSRPTDIKLNAGLISDQGTEATALNYLASKLANIKFPENEAEWDPEINLHRYTVSTASNGQTIYTRGNLANNLANLIFDVWRTQNESFYNNQPSSIKQKIQFAEPTAMFMSGRVVVLVNEIDFNIQFLRSESEFEVDRGKQYPLILENVIDRAIAPLSTVAAGEESKFSMCDSILKENIDLSKKPDGVVGRDGVTLSIRCDKPIDILDADPAMKMYELVAQENQVIWVPINSTTARAKNLT